MFRFVETGSEFKEKYVMMELIRIMKDVKEIALGLWQDGLVVEEI